MKDPDHTFVHLGHGSLFGGNVSGGNDAVRFFASGDIDNEIGPIQMPNFEMARFDSAHVPVRDEWYHPRGAAARVVPRQPVRLAQPEVRS